MKRLVGTAGMIIIVITLFAQVTTDTTITREWNDITNEWEPFNRKIEYYNHGDKISELMQVYENERWINYSFMASTFDKNGNIVEQVEQFWNDTQLSWIDNSSTTYFYDRNNHVIEIIYQNFYNEELQNSFRELFSYYEDGNVKQRVMQIFFNGWENHFMSGYIYSGGVLSEETKTSWANNNWSTTMFVEAYMYNTAGQIARKTKTRIDKDGSTNISKEQYYLDPVTMTGEIAVSNWNAKKNTWMPRSRVKITKDHNMTAVTSQCMVWNNNNWDNYLLITNTRDNASGFCLPLTHEKTFTISANPARNIATIEFDNPDNENLMIRIIDQSGALIAMSQTSGTSLILDDNILNPGLYIVEIQGDGLYTGKFSIE